MHLLTHVALSIGVSFAALFLLAVLLTMAGRFMGRFATQTPGLDLWVSLFTWVPWVVGARAGGWGGLAGVIVGQLLALYLWCFLHESLHPAAARGPRIVKFLNRLVGRWRNHAALWATLLALPIFWLIRLGEVTMYWPLRWLLNFPAYRQADWINVSRQKFDGLIGHDLVWCLYCDWMTGVYSLGAEMLRNVESFWCPIRYYDGKKCENCKLDFPDIDHGWVRADGTMQDVEHLMQDKYGGGERAWFGHPVRLTVKGVDPAAGGAASLGSGE